VAAYLNDEWLVTGYDTFDAAIDDPDYYKNVFVSHRFVRRQWSDHLAIEAIYPRAFGTQDLCVLRRQSDAPATAETA
jgi:hypothetical protein